jgi:acyl-CoA thioester hydrolase
MNLREQARALAPAAFPMRMDVQGRYRDVDARRHINNIAIAEMFSEARSHFIRALFTGLDGLEDQFFVVGQQALFYADEAHFPGSIEIGTGLYDIDRSTLRIGQAFINRGRCTAIAESVLVFSRAGRAAVLAPAMRDVCVEFLFREGCAPPRQLIVPEGAQQMPHGDSIFGSSRP